jgi:hypothetical protein
MCIGHVAALVLQVLQQIKDRGSNTAQLPDWATSSGTMLLLLLLLAALPAAAAAALGAHSPGWLRCRRLVQQAAARR